MAGKKRRILLADTALFTVLFIAVRLVLHLFRLNYRKWFLVLCLFLITVGIIAGIIQLLLKIRKRAVRIIAVSMTKTGISYLRKVLINHLFKSYIVQEDV